MATVQSSIARNRAERRTSQNLPRHKTPTGKSIHAQRALRRRDVAGASEEGQRMVHNSLRYIPRVGNDLHKSYGKMRIKKRRTKAFVRGGLIAYSLTWFYPVQLLFAIIFVLALGAASMISESNIVVRWLAGDVAESVMVIAWVLLIALGTGMMIYAAAMFAAFNVPVWRHSSVFLMFSICLAGYWAPVLFFFPWVFLWIAVVVFAQK